MMETRFMIPRGGPGEADHVVISVGGRTFKIKRGVEYVVREKGEWEWYVEPRGYFTTYDEDFGYRCPKCKVYAREWGADDDIFEEPPVHIHFCPNCGADLRKEKSDGTAQV